MASPSEAGSHLFLNFAILNFDTDYVMGRMVAARAYAIEKGWMRPDLISRIKPGLWTDISGDQRIYYGTTQGDPGFYELDVTLGIGAISRDFGV